MDQANEDTQRCASNLQRQDLVGRILMAATQPSTHHPRQRWQMWTSDHHPPNPTSHSCRPLPPPAGGPALDPTGMYQNRGRRVVARSRVASSLSSSGAARKDDDVGPAIVPSLPPNPTSDSPPKSRQQNLHRGNHRDALASSNDPVGTLREARWAWRFRVRLVRGSSQAAGRPRY